MRPSLIRAALVVTGALVLAVGCSGGSKDDEAGVPSTLGPSSNLPESSGFTCTDPIGDIGSDLSGAGTKSEPAGIDIVTAEAHVDGDVLAVTYTMAGPIMDAPSPFFVMLQGDISAAQYSFDLRTEPSGPNGTWVLKVGTTPAGGGVETFATLSTPVRADGAVLRYRVPLSDIPRIATLQWSFGATSTAADNSVLFDDCSSVSAATQSTPPIVTVPPTSGD
jgi:hypothetical protein